jgi:hypothetical protein
MGDSLFGALFPGLRMIFVGGIVVSVFGVLTLLLWAAKRGRPSADERRGVLLFRHSAIFRGFALVTAGGIPMVLTVLVFVFPPKDEGDVGAIVGVHVLVIALTWPLLWEALRFGVMLSPEGLDCRSPWRGSRFLRWEEVRAISWSDMGSWFIIHARDGYRFRVPSLAAGLDRFLACCEEHLRPDQLEPALTGYVRVGRKMPAAEPPPVDLTRWGERPGGSGSASRPARRDHRTRRSEDGTQRDPDDY